MIDLIFNVSIHLLKSERFFYLSKNKPLTSSVLIAFLKDHFKYIKITAGHTVVNIKSDIETYIPQDSE